MTKTAKKKSASTSADSKVAGIIELFEFDPRTGCGTILICTVDATGHLIAITHEFREAGGVLSWDGDNRSIPTLDRYIARRKILLDKCPSVYPLRDVVIAPSSVSKRYIHRLFQTSSEKLASYVNEYRKELDDIMKGEKTLKEILNV